MKTRKILLTAANPQLYSGDFLHLKPAGYSTRAQAIEPTLNTLLQE